MNTTAAPRPARTTAQTGVTPLRRPDPLSTITIDVGVDNNHCHLYAICQHEAPDVFQLVGDKRLRFVAKPPTEALERVRSAARLCPMQAITVVVRR